MVHNAGGLNSLCLWLLDSSHGLAVFGRRWEGVSSVECGFGCVFFSLCCCLTWSELQEAVSCSERQECVHTRVRVLYLSMYVSMCRARSCLFRREELHGESCTDPWVLLTQGIVFYFIYCSWQRHCLGNHDASPLLSGAFCVIGVGQQEQPKEQDWCCLAQGTQGLTELLRGTCTSGKCCSGLSCAALSLHSEACSIPLLSQGWSIYSRLAWALWLQSAAPLACWS